MKASRNLDQEDPMSSHLTPEQAREQLMTTRTRSLDSSRDRGIHAIGTAVFGLTIGLFGASRNMTEGPVWFWGSLAYFVITIGVAFWVERTAQTVPRRARLWSRLGMAGSLVLCLVVVLPWLNLSAQTAPNTWGMVLIGGLGAAVPALIGAALIARGRK